MWTFFVILKIGDHMTELQKIQEAHQYVLRHMNGKPKIGLVLGSGLGNILNDMTEKVEIPLSVIPYFEKPTTVGHDGILAIGYIKNVLVIALSGRYHFYEGYDLQTVTRPIRLMKMLGVKTLILTNACGAINTSYQPGDLMIINDHINTTARNPLIGLNIDELGPRFPDASNIYTKKLVQLAHEIAENEHMKLQEGVYAWWTGPSYETPAEIRMLRILGADAVGMSTVPEALVASHMQMDVLGISCLTNMASGILDQKLSHQEVLDVAKSVNIKFKHLISEIITKI